MLLLLTCPAHGELGTCKANVVQEPLHVRAAIFAGMESKLLTMLSLYGSSC